MRVLLVTSDREECGIRSYSEMLKEAVEAAGSEVEIQEWPFPNWPEDTSPTPGYLDSIDIIHCNHHAALSSFWKPSTLELLHENGFKVVVTQHDTFERFEIMQERGLPDFRGADALVVHEEVAGLEGSNIHYLKQPVPTFPGWTQVHKRPHPDYKFTVGSIGFPFDWKNYPLLCRAAKKAGWGCYLIAPGITLEQTKELFAQHPGVEIEPRFLPKLQALQRLRSHCDATAFLYAGGGSGTSGAIRMGIAARRPVLAFQNRQFRDLDLPGEYIWWQHGEEFLVRSLNRFVEDAEIRAAWEAGIQSLAGELSWDRAAKVYSSIYRSLVGEKK